MKSRVLELNASDERGIAVVRDKIKHFAKLAVSNPAPGQTCPPFKIIILDEADSMTQDAQGALRRIMEQYSRITRFCLICNYVTRIIEPLASRCSKFRFKPLDSASAEARLAFIADAERVPADPAMIKALVESADGDMRRAITYLQSAARLVGARNAPLSADAVAELAGVVPKPVIERLAHSIGVDGEGSSFDGILASVKSVVLEGYSCIQVLLQLHDFVVEHPLLPAAKKTRCALRFGETDKALIDGGNEELQLLSLCLALQDLYELFCVAIAQTESAALRDLVSSTSRLIFDHGGVVRNVQYWGKRTLPQRARRHQQYHTAGDYWLMQFDTNAPTLKVLNDRLRQDPRVIKWNTLKLGEKLGEIVPPGVSGGTTSSKATMGGRTVDYLG
ncbi:Subunit of heteropentameric Replication factor C (RF-C) [Malassezia cuniculi]|uniref:Subunit of heteropentameric Replication factor C (RF-C) n=1 Tax=Malassezia cuniculi TaxID=948313 RepID=A0AAF0J7T1_9BASI|nr:Subunit of heteropentameric Replication factor C (RF-C) [Malassezia cuniculi]